MEEKKKVSRLKALTENKYTAYDLFTKNYQIWALIPLILYLLTPVVHMIVYSIMYTGEAVNEEINHYMNTGELPGDYYMPIIQLFMVIGAVVTIIAFGSFLSYRKQNTLKRYPDNIPVFIFLGYIVLIVVSTIVNKTSFNYIFGFTVRAEGVLSVIAYYLVYYFCGSLIDKEKIKRFIIYFFLSTGIVIGVLTLIDFFGVNVKIIGDNGVCGIFYHWNFYAYYLSISIPLAAGLVLLEKNKAGKIFGLVVFAIDTFILAIDDSMGGFLASTVALVFLFVAVSIKKKKFSFTGIGLIALFMGIIFVTGLFYQSYFSELLGLGNDVKKIVTDADDAGEAGTERWNLWTHTAQYIKEKPLLGWGFEGIAERLGKETNADKAHNEYLENMAYYGIPAGILYLAALISVYIKALIRRKHVDEITICCLAAALGYIGSALVGNSFIFMSPFCFIFLGLANQTIPAADNSAEEPEDNTEEIQDDNIEESTEDTAKESEEKTEGMAEDINKENTEISVQ